MCDNFKLQLNKSYNDLCYLYKQICCLNLNKPFNRYVNEIIYSYVLNFFSSRLILGFREKEDHPRYRNHIKKSTAKTTWRLGNLCVLHIERRGWNYWQEESSLWPNGLFEPSTLTLTNSPLWPCQRSTNTKTNILLKLNIDNYIFTVININYFLQTTLVICHYCYCVVGFTLPFISTFIKLWWKPFQKIIIV